MGDKDFQNEMLDRYLELNSSPEPDLLRKLRINTMNEFSQHHMISGHVQGRFLSTMSKILQPAHILEIGTFTGYATLCLAEGLIEDGKITTIDINPDLQDFYQPYFNVSGFNAQINSLIANAITFLEKSKDTYDLIFLDANKKQYIDYFELLVPRMKPGGVILADNTLWKGKVMQAIDAKDKMTQALFDFNQHITQDTRVEVVLIPLRDGISLIRKK